MTGDDLVEAKLGVMGVPFQRKRPDGSPMFARAFLGLAQGTVRYVGEPVAFVVAETLAQAKDAAELVEIDYEALPSVTGTAEAAEGKIAVWDECPDNISNLFEAGNKPRPRRPSPGLSTSSSAATSSAGCMRIL
jgi:aerobic carbon-monoxide dehydrogenase large subunit